MRWRPFSVAVALASCCTIALELLLTRIFSVTMYYHFAYLVISIAMLGLSISGVSIYLLPKWFQSQRAPLLGAVFMLVFSQAVPWTLRTALHSPISLEHWQDNLGSMGILYLSTGLTMLASGFAISLAIASAGPRIGQIYAFDLVGAALGCFLIIPAISIFGGPGALLACAGLGAVSAAVFALSSSGSKAARYGLAGIATLAAVNLFVLASSEGRTNRFGLARNEEKFLGKNAVMFEKWNSFSQITVSSSGAPDYLWIIIDADAATRLWSAEVSRGRTDAPLRYSEVKASSMVYALRHERPALIIGPGGGTDVIAALHHGVPQVVGVEVNPIIVNDVVRGQFAEYGGDLYRDPRVRVFVDEGRSFVRRSKGDYGSVQATLVDTWAASSSGAFTLSENNIYTVEAFEEFLSHMAPGGILAITRWYNPEQPREFLRLVALGRQALENRGVRPAEIARYIALVADFQYHGTLLLSRDPFSPEDVQILNQQVKERELSLLFAPALADGSAQAPADEDPVLANYLRAPSGAQFLAQLPYDASPTSDSRPFFFYNLRPGDVLTAFGHLKELEKDNLGVIVLLVLFVFSAALVALFVFVPLLVFERKALRTQRRAKLRVLTYFLCLGMGFILVEIGFMQKFVLFLGHPIYSLAVVLASLLLSSGVGSALSGIGDKRWGVVGYTRRVVLALAAVLALYGLLLTPIFHALLGLALFVRIPIAVLLVSVPGLLMGALMPNGVRVGNQLGPGTVAWGWGLNGAAGVIGSVLAVGLSMSFGFDVALGLGVLIYLGGMVAFPRLAPTAA